MSKLNAFKVIRTAFVVAFFFIGCLSICLSQFIIILLFNNYPELKQSLLNYTKKNFVILLTFITQIVSPTEITVTCDETLPSGSFQSINGTLHGALSAQSVIIANHQLYTDWLFLWFLSYTSRLGDSVFIMLKDLSKIPILGYGMKNYNFLFLSRKWEKDKITLTNQLLIVDANARGLGPSNGVKHLSSRSSSDITKWPSGENPNNKSTKWPFQLILYPEGTVMCDNRRQISENFCKTRNIPILRHLLLPRSRGLFFSLRQLKKSCDVVYDVTVGYSNLAEDEYGEVKYTLGEFFIHGNGPGKVNIYIRSFKIDDIPLGDDSINTTDEDFEAQLEAFEKWLIERWFEKDELLHNFFHTGEFLIENEETKNILNNKVAANIKLNNWYEILDIFKIPFILLLLLRLVWSLVSKLF